jgi:RNA polymerase sigma factor FliA
VLHIGAGRRDLRLLGGKRAVGSGNLPIAVALFGWRTAAATLALSVSRDYPRRGDELGMAAMHPVQGEAAQQALTRAEADALAEQHLPLVDYAVSDVASRLPTHIRRDELRSAGMLALVQASRAYDPSRGVPFASFAKPRLRGAVLDELRDRDWLSRTVRLRARQRNDAEDALSVQLGRYPTAAELADYLGVPVADVATVDVHRSFVLSLSVFADAGTLEGMLPDDGPGPEEWALAQERLAYLAAAVAALPRRLRRVIEDYYLRERPMVETAAALGLSESRISQMRAEALALLKDGLTAVLSPEHAQAGNQQPAYVARRRARYQAEIVARFRHRTHREIGAA